MKLTWRRPNDRRRSGESASWGYWWAYGVECSSRLRKVAAACADFVLPPLCVACNVPLASHDALCPGCWSQIDFIRPPLCDRLGLPMPFDTGGVMISAMAAADPPDFDRARAVARFDGIMRALIHDLKFRDRHYSKRCSGDGWRKRVRSCSPRGFSCPYRLRGSADHRRFNQAAILANEIARQNRHHGPLALQRRRTPRPR